MGSTRARGRPIQGRRGRKTLRPRQGEKVLRRRQGEMVLRLRQGEKTLRRHGEKIISGLQRNLGNYRMSRSARRMVLNK